MLLRVMFIAILLLRRRQQHHRRVGSAAAMRAVVQHRYGSIDALELREIELPAVAEDEVLVHVHAASVHPDVWHVVLGRPYVLRLMGAGLRRPRQRIPGTDLAGRVHSTGARVTRLEAGDAVFGESVRGNQWRNGGAFAEYAAVPAEALAPMPPGLSFEQAAAVPTSGLIALRGVRDEGHVRAGQSVLVNGAGGGVGMFAVQLAKAYGAEVTGVDTTSKLEPIRSIGADHVIDCTHEDFTSGPRRYDVIVDVPGNHPLSDCRRALTPTGRYVLIGHDGFGATRGRWLGSLPTFIRLLAMSPFVRQLPTPSFSLPSKRDSLAVLSEFLHDGRITPVVDRTFALAEVRDAIRYLQSGRATGKVVLTL
jgi:NADPH:quinone reductase-like Zn-dependent oxidoreductase